MCQPSEAGIPKRLTERKRREAAESRVVPKQQLYSLPQLQSSPFITQFL